VNNLTKSNEKPVLGPEGFQRLLAAAFILQGQNDPCPANPNKRRPYAYFRDPAYCPETNSLS